MHLRSESLTAHCGNAADEVRVRPRWVLSATLIGLITACADTPTDPIVLPSVPAVVSSIRLVTTEKRLGIIARVRAVPKTGHMRAVQVEVRHAQLG